MITALEVSLEKAMHADKATSTGKRILVGVDVSGSMNVPSTMTEYFSCASLAGALACVLANSDNVDVIAYGTRIVIPPANLLFTKSPFLWSEAFAQLYGGGTDCTLPEMYALDRLKKGLDSFDAIVNITDNMTWAGHHHAPVVLRELRNKAQKPVRYVNIQMAPYTGIVADPNDKDVLDTVGFDVSALPAIKSFIRGEL